MGCHVHSIAPIENPFDDFEAYKRFKYTNTARMRNDEFERIAPKSVSKESTCDRSAFPTKFNGWSKKAVWRK